MVPLHYAYLAGDTSAIQEFRRFKERFLENLSDFTKARLPRLHMIYFLSNFAALEARRNTCQEAGERLFRFLQQELDSVLLAPAWHWSEADFSTMIDRVRWKLRSRNVERSYFRAIIGEELFAMGVASNLLLVHRLCHWETSDATKQAVDLGFDVIRQEGATVGSGWLFQQGVWTDHPDYRYAGHSIKAPRLQPRPVPGIGTDSSHHHTMPLILSNFACAYQGSRRESVFREAMAGLRQQWASRVLLMPSQHARGIRLRNYMTGDDGLFRYNYEGQKGGGFGPLELSGTFNLGWWSFLGTGLPRHAYRVQLSYFPFSDELVELYTSRAESFEIEPRAQHPMIKGQEFLASGIAYELVRMAANMPQGSACETGIRIG
jgi:hypothetical protein